MTCTFQIVIYSLCEVYKEQYVDSAPLLLLSILLPILIISFQTQHTQLYTRYCKVFNSSRLPKEIRTENMDAQSTQGRVIENTVKTIGKLNEKLSYYDLIKEAFPEPFNIMVKNEEFAGYHNIVKDLPIHKRNQARQANKGYLPLAFHVDIRPEAIYFVVTIASRGFKSQSATMKEFTTFWVEARVHRLANDGKWQEVFNRSYNGLRLHRFREVTFEEPSSNDSGNTLKTKYSVATLSYEPNGLKEETAREWIAADSSSIMVILDLTAGARGTEEPVRLPEMTVSL